MEKTEEKDITQFGIPSINLETDSIGYFITDFNDTIPDDTLWVNYSKDGLPLSFHRNISTGVCIEGECLPIRTTMYWNFSGRFHGFKLQKGDFFSKTEHKEFTEEEYFQLFKILSDPWSPLANLTYDKLIPQKDSLEDKVDAVTQATNPDIIKSIVNGAVYTTFTLWHISNGTTKERAEEKSKELLNTKIANSLLESEVPEDILWTLQQMQLFESIDESSLKIIFKIIDCDDIVLVDAALKSIPNKALKQNSTEHRLLNTFQKSNSAKQRMIVQRLINSSSLSESTITFFATNLEFLNGALFKLILEMFKKHEVSSTKVCLELSKLLDHDNPYISNKIYEYLVHAKCHDKKVQKRLSKKSALMESP
ncbi:hypothetical protein [uncultured Draconibacterium sp.]|uniref:hypothetical protein n=1 Tax=uncultured Draconibacterium sp. TaxID=1573823 RepID=UPI0025F5F6D2|nr:hypothetical protein [uncultured Draconibacterium sp.]